MARHEHKSGAWFELPDDISQKQLEACEKKANEIVAKEGRTDAFLARAAIEGAFAGGFLTPGDGVPQKVAEIAEFTSKITWWMSKKIAAFLAEIKTIDPN